MVTGVNMVDVRAPRYVHVVCTKMLVGSSPQRGLFHMMQSCALHKQPHPPHLNREFLPMVLSRYSTLNCVQKTALFLISSSLHKNCGQHVI